jgi:Uma2 family endonuclease
MVDGKREATYQDVLDAPEHMVAEILDGELILSPRPAPRHTSVATVLGAALVPPFSRGRGGPGGWIILHEPELHFGKRVVVPDLAGWRRERMPSIPDKAAYFTVVPDWICEIASKSTEKLDRRKKLPLYARVGVAHAWMVHPRLRTLEVLRRQAENWVLVAVFGDDERIRAEPFEAIELALADLWADLPSRASEPVAEYGDSVW